MDLENNSQGDDIVGIVSSNPSIGVPMGGLVENAKYLYKIPYSCLRQNSINDSKQYNDLKDQKDHNENLHRSKPGIPSVNPLGHYVDLKSNTTQAAYIRDISKVDKTDDPLLKTHLDRNTKMYIHKDFVKEDVDVEDGCYGNRGRGKGRCACVVSACSCLTSVLTLCMVVLFIIPKINDTILHEAQDATSMAHSGISSGISSSGNFKINQTFLRDYKRVVWEKDENSDITPNPDDDCLSVANGGKYLVFSRFTFNIHTGDDVDKAALTHNFKLKTSSGIMKDGGFKRKYVSILENKLRTHMKSNFELRKPSVFIELFELDARDQICLNVSRPELLYVSRMDNDVNIIKV